MRNYLYYLFKWCFTQGYIIHTTATSIVEDGGADPRREGKTGLTPDVTGMGYSYVMPNAPCAFNAKGYY